MFRLPLHRGADSALDGGVVVEDELLDRLRTRVSILGRLHERRGQGVRPVLGLQRIQIGLRLESPPKRIRERQAKQPEKRYHAMRRAGASYEEIAKAGGGIASTVKRTAAASDEQLLEQSRRRLHALMRGGCTTVEVKSGYGLDTKSELRLLKIANELGEAEAVRIVPTLLALHAIPADQADRRAHYVGEIVDKLIPAAAKQGIATSVDAFCDTIAFTPQEVERLFKAAAHHEPQSVEITAFRDDFDIPGVTSGGWPPASGAVALAERGRHLLVAEMPKHIGVIFQLARDDVDYAIILVLLDDAVNAHQPRAHDDLALLREDVGPDDQIGDAGFILQRDEYDALGASWPLADQHQSRDRQPFAVTDGLELVGGNELQTRIMLAQEAHAEGPAHCRRSD